MGRKWNFERAKQKFEENGYILLENDYLGHLAKHGFICDRGHKLEIVFKDFVAGNRCRYCKGENMGNRLRKSIEEVQKEFEDGGCVLLSTEYKDSRQKLDYICVCGRRDVITRVHFYRGQRCRECGINKIWKANSKYDIEFAKQAFANSGLELLEDNYRNVEISMRYKCKTCGCISSTSLKVVLGESSCRACFYVSVTGENSPNWNPELTAEDRANERNMDGYSEWRTDVYRRDDYTCQICKDDKGGNLNAHHLNGYDWCKEQRVDVDNGITLCSTCHKEFHGLYKYGGNTKEQYLEWATMKERGDVIA